MRVEGREEEGRERGLRGEQGARSLLTLEMSYQTADSGDWVWS